MPSKWAAGYFYYIEGKDQTSESKYKADPTTDTSIPGKDYWLLLPLVP